MNDLRERPLSITIAQLRHLYAHLFNGTFSDAAELAVGLLGPEIQALERLSDAAIAAGVGEVLADLARRQAFREAADLVDSFVDYTGYGPDRDLDYGTVKYVRGNENAKHHFALVFRQIAAAPTPPAAAEEG